MWLIIQQRFDNDCSINQLAWLIIRLWLSHIDYSWLINQLTTLIIHSSSQGSSINQLAWLIIRVLIIQQRFDIDCLINQLAWLIIRQWLSHIDYSWLINTLMKLMIHSGSQASSINQLAWLIIRVTDYSAMIRQWLFDQPARVIDYSTMIISHWLFIRVVNRVQSTNSGSNCPMNSQGLIRWGGHLTIQLA